MFRKLRGSFKSDDGMSIIEVVFAAAIMFFVLTAVLGLVAATTRMGVSARQRTAMNNAISSQLEWMRSLDFEQLAIAGTSDEGVIDSTTVMSVDGFTITITTAIDDGVGNTREVQVTAVADAEGVTSMSRTASVVIRDSDSLIVMFDDEGPDVEYTNTTPAKDTVVYSSYVQGGSPLYLSIDAEAQGDDGLLSNVSMYCLDTLLRNGNTTFAGVASWQPDSHDFSTTFRWDTRQLGEDNGEPPILDGWRLVRTVAEDSNGSQGIAERRFYVDNHMPGLPGEPEALIHSDLETRVSWDEAIDGTGPALRYFVRWAQVTASGSLTGYVEVPIELTNVYLHQTDPFSRYTISVAASTPRNLTTEYVPIAVPYVSRPAASGDSITVYEGKNTRRVADTTVHLDVQDPNFPVTDISYDLYRSTDPETLMDGQPYATDIDPGFTEVVRKNVGRTGVPDTLYYAYKITFTPSGYMGGDSEEVWSDIVGPITPLETLQPMEHALW